MTDNIKVYAAESSIRRPREILRAMFFGLIHSRYMAYRICVKDIRAEYSKSAFGILWDFADPLVLGTIFFFLAKVRVINPGTLGMPYAVFVIYGLLLFLTFSESVTLSLGMMKRSKTILTHLKVPPEALILSVFFRVTFNSVFRIAVMLLFSLLLDRSAAADGQSTFALIGFAKFLLLYPMLILAGMSLGVFLAPFNAIYADVGRAVRIVLLILRYASPVLYKIPSAFPFNWVYVVNPIALLLTNLRSLATSNTVSDLPGLAVQCSFFFVVLAVGCLLFHLAVPILAEKA